MTNQNNKPATPPQFPVPRNSTPNQPSGASRFGNRSSSSRFGGSSSSSRFGGSSRFGSREAVQWTVTPSKKSAVRISLEGLGDPLHRLLGTDLNPDFSDPAKIIETLSNDTELLEKLSEVLDISWESYKLRGAAMLYPWEENIRKAFTDTIQPTPPPPPKKEEKSDGDEDFYDDDDDAEIQTPDWLTGLAKNKTKRVKTFRAIDVAFVMNILARSRANVVVGNTPLALEPGFLEKTVICEDPRIVKLAQATGCIDEEW